MLRFFTYFEVILLLLYTFKNIILIAMKRLYLIKKYFDKLIEKLHFQTVLYHTALDEIFQFSAWRKNVNSYLFYIET